MPNLNEYAWHLVEAACSKAERLGIAWRRTEDGCLVLDCGIFARGSLEAGLVMAEVGMAGLGQTHLEMGILCSRPWQWAAVETDDPMQACFLSQAAHWPVAVENYHGMGSGPACLLNPGLGLAEKYGYSEQAGKAVLVLETGQLPDPRVRRELANVCGVTTDNLAILAAPTASPAGRVQIAARSIETALHKLAQLGFNLHDVVQGTGKCPLAPDGQDDLAAMGTTNDMMIFGSQVRLEIHGADDERLDQIARAVPSQASPNYGEPFLDILKASGGFYAIDPGLFAPAQITLTSQDSGNSFHAGRVDEAQIAKVLEGSPAHD